MFNDNGFELIREEWMSLKIINILEYDEHEGNLNENDISKAELIMDFCAK